MVGHHHPGARALGQLRGAGRPEMRLEGGDVKKDHIHAPDARQLFDEPGVAGVPDGSIGGPNQIPAAIPSLPALLCLPIMQGWGHGDFHAAHADHVIISGRDQALWAGAQLL